jgi:hypothetical protein
MTTVRRGTNVPARWRLFVCGLALLASCPLPAQAESWVPYLSRLWAGPLRLDPDAALPAPTRISFRSINTIHTDGIRAPLRRELTARIPAELGDVLVFYRTELAKLGWQEEAPGAAIAAERVELTFTSPEGPATLKLDRAKGETTVSLVQRNTEAAAKADILPMPGKARLIFGYLVPDVASLAIDDQTIKIAGGAGHPQALDLPPGTYSYQLLLSGHPVVTKTITVAKGEAWDLELGSDGDKAFRIY